MRDKEVLTVGGVRVTAGAHPGFRLEYRHGLPELAYIKFSLSHFG